MNTFTIEQFSHSDTAVKRNIDNSLPVNLRPNAQKVIDIILIPLQKAWGETIILTSGYRGDALNTAIGGSKTSAHSYAWAVDMVPANGNIEEFKQFVMKWLLNNQIIFDQYINEYSGRSSWVHIGLNRGSGKPRKQYVLYKDGKYTQINPYLYRGGEDIGSSSSSGSNTGNSVNSGGNTQTGSTSGLLTGKSVYLNNINIEAVKANDVFEKDETGEPLLDADGNLIVTDSYLLGGANEKESDEIEDISELEAEKIEIDLSVIETDKVEQVKGVKFAKDGTYVVNQSKSIQEILAMVQQWWELIQTLKKMKFKLQKHSTSATQEPDGTMTINTLAVMQAAFDMYGHAYREGMMCPVCGKKARYLPPGGYCSVECLIKAAKDKALAFLMQPNEKFKPLQDKLELLCAILDQTNLLINAITMIPDIIKELASLPEEWKQYVRNKIAEGFAELQELIQKLMKKKNELLERILKPINFGIIAKPIAAIIGVIQTIQQALQITQEAFEIAFDTVKLILDKLTTVSTAPPGLKLPAESFAWALTPRSFISPMPYTNPDCGKIFVVLPGGGGVPIEGFKPLLPSALQSINFEAIDAVIQSLFPPLTPLDYYLDPPLFQIRYLFSDQSDLVFQIRQQLEDFLKAGPDYIPNFENLLPIKTYTFEKGTENEKQIPLPNIGYIWFLLGLMDAWGPHSQALVGSIFNPAI